ncbi:RNA polymerase II transcription factor B 52 kDa subunit [Entomophthora muscae]|uniref:RNA polymerase II transcription factor B 52 kDa subunit n=1 Tax=Entomophthora muscae TaxID=34485 RepID=A0ACC2SJL3_9FUNG|nr:RNA polymerase II transcription factor B 52 kDa subunit [Entomophthora muscae]
MSNLFASEPIPVEKFFSGVQNGSIGKVKGALRKALRLHIFSTVKDLSHKEGSNSGTSLLLKMSSTFRTHLQHALCGSGSSTSFGEQFSTPDKHKMSIERLDLFAEKRWELILHYMVGTISEKVPSDKARRLLLRAGLMAKSIHGDKMKITNRGFQFLLKDKASQIWFFLLQYLAVVVEQDKDQVEVLNFFFLLGSMELGCDYSVDSLTPTQRELIKDLQDYGVVYQRKPGSRRFYPTRLATTLLSGDRPSFDTAKETASREADQNADENAKDASGDDNAGIIVETNYRVYAYTKSPLQIAILNLFISLKARFANMIEGYLDRESIRRALSHGITAEQIIKYLETHAHPQMRKHSPIIPITVVDQIRLWEMEKDRVRSAPGHLWRDFARQQDFDAIYKFARTNKALLWSSPAKRLMVMSPAGHKLVSAYAQRLQRGGSSATARPDAA